MVSRLGNNAPSKKATGTGSGATHRRAPFGHLTIGGKAGETVRISADELFNTISLGTVFLQASGGPVTVHYTLADIDLALSPTHDGGDHWISQGAVAVGAIVALPIGTAYRLTFTGNTMVYMAGV